jgi:hypothetical protein
MSLHQFRSWPCWMNNTPKRKNRIELDAGRLVMPQAVDPFGAWRIPYGEGNGDGWRIDGTGTHRGNGWMLDDCTVHQGTGKSRSMWSRDD